MILVDLQSENFGASQPAKCQQNVSGRLTSTDRTQDRYTIRGYLSTAAKHGHNMLTALRDAITWAAPHFPDS